MPIVSHLHHLFNSETCQAYIHTLRWKDRPLQCPRCQSLNVGPWRTYHAQSGLKHYRCKEQGCKRTFNSTFRTLFHPSEATFEGPPAETGGGALYTLLDIIGNSV